MTRKLQIGNLTDVNKLYPFVPSIHLSKKSDVETKNTIFTVSLFK